MIQSLEIITKSARKHSTPTQKRGDAAAEADDVKVMLMRKLNERICIQCNHVPRGCPENEAVCCCDCIIDGLLLCCFIVPAAVGSSGLRVSIYHRVLNTGEPRGARLP